jgi:hypothetical protein
MGVHPIKPMASLGAGLLGRAGSARRVPLSFAPVEPLLADPLADPLADAEVPEVMLQVARLAQAFAPALSAEPAAGPQPVVASGRRVAFTLRLDPVHHDRLRRVAAAQNRSAQQVLVDALDHYSAGASGTAATSATVPLRRKALNGNPS